MERFSFNIWGGRFFRGLKDTDHHFQIEWEVVIYVSSGMEK